MIYRDIGCLDNHGQESLIILSSLWSCPPQPPPSSLSPYELSPRRLGSSVCLCVRLPPPCSSCISPCLGQTWRIPRERCVDSPAPRPSGLSRTVPVLPSEPKPSCRPTRSLYLAANCVVISGSISVMAPRDAKPPTGPIGMWKSDNYLPPFPPTAIC